MAGLSVSNSKDSLGIDGAITVIARDLLTDPAKESRFRAALKISGIVQDPQHVRGIRSINAAYGIEIPEYGAEIPEGGLKHRQHIDELLSGLSDGQRLALGNGIEHSFFSMLAQYAEKRIDILQS